LESVGIQERVCTCCEADRAENSDEYALDQDGEHDEGDSKGPESMFVEMNFLPVVARAVMDTGAKSFWVDKAWFLEIGGTMKMCSGEVFPLRAMVCYRSLSCGDVCLTE
jgi:hypothetical protein